MPGIPASEWGKDQEPPKAIDELTEHLGNLKQACKADWVRLAEEALTPDQRLGLRCEIESIVADMAKVLNELDANRS